MKTLKKPIAFLLAATLSISSIGLSHVRAAESYTKTAQATVELSSDGNLTSSGSASETLEHEIVSIDSVKNDNGTVRTKLSGKIISATWSGGEKSNEEVWLPATSSMYYGSNSKEATWTKQLPHKIVRNVQAIVTPSGSAKVNGNIITFSGKGAVNSNTNWNNQSVTASAKDGKTDQQTAGYGVTADLYELVDLGYAGDVKDHKHNYNNVHAYASVTASDPSPGKSTAGTAYTNVQYQNFYYLYYSDAVYEYLAPSGTYNYAATVTYTYKYEVDAGLPIVTVTNDAPTPLYRGTKVTFTGTATDTKGKIVSQQWSGIGTGNKNTTTYTPTKLGKYTATFTAVNDAGRKASASSTITVINKPPVASIGSAKTTMYRNETLDLTGYAKDDDGTIVSTTWSGAISGTGYKKTFTPKKLGTYKITFKVKDNDGATAEDSITIKVINRAPSVTIISPKGTSGDPAMLSSSGGSFNWSFSDPDDDPQTSYRVEIYDYEGKKVDSGQVLSGSKSYNLPYQLDPDRLYYWTVTVTDPWSTVTSDRSYFRVDYSENFTVTSVTPSGKMETVSTDPKVDAFIVGKYGPASFTVNVNVRKTAGDESGEYLYLTLNRSGYGLNWSERKRVYVDRSGTTVSFTVPNITHEDIRAWQKSKGNKVTLYEPFKLTATLEATRYETNTGDNTLSNSLRTAEYGRSQLTK
ncbi:PKD domain-containing protein [Paenibacillus sp. 1A_MP2]|uniref:PKD domain-containing protein n=1 Tax=Paenibacillus sp. 1A_MP2 TaxID=3457495 RepID=UPI003FCD09EC